jgi:hypothetical protein
LGRNNSLKQTFLPLIEFHPSAALAPPTATFAPDSASFSLKFTGRSRHTENLYLGFQGRKRSHLNIYNGDIYNGDRTMI